VSLFDRSGKLVKRLVAKGQGYVFGTPTDVAFDSLGHLYVLDRGASAVYVFSAAGTLVTYITVPERAPGALRHATALAIDSAGRLFVYDDDLERMLVYQ
jgi:sugar lactone lactonase YvrE